MFDPYDQWLGIPKDRRPITYYHLLAVPPGKADPGAVNEAARRQLARLGKYRDGPHAEACERLVREVKKARDALRDPATRKKYDALLARRTPADEPVEVTEEFVEEEEAPEEAAEEAADEAPAERRRPGRRSPGGRKGKSRRPEPSRRSWVLPVVGAGAFVLLLAGGGLAFWLTRPAKSDAAPAPAPVAEAPRPRLAPSPAPKAAPPPPPAPVAVAKAPAPAPTPPAPTPPAPTPPAPRGKAKPAKIKVPPDDALARAEKEIKEKYKDDYTRDKAEDRLAQSAKFLQPGRENREDPASWYVLLREARDLAVQAGRPRLAVEAVDEIDTWFLVDPVALKLQALTALGQEPTEATARVLAPVALNQIDQAVASENFDAAQKILALAEAARPRAYPPRDAAGDKLAPGRGPKPKQNPPEKAKPADPAVEQKLADRLDSVRTRLAEARKEHEAVVAARATLKGEPGNAPANRVAGQHLCFVQGRWDQGLPLLAKGDDPLLRRLAQLEAAPPPDVKGQLEAGEGWWAVGRRRSGLSQDLLWERAAGWFDLAEAKAAPAEKKRIQEQRKDRGEQVAATYGLRLQPGSFYGRGVEDRVLLLREGGGTMKSEEAVERGLEWLARHQARSGGWSLDAFAADGKCNCGDPGAKHDVAATSFALLPFLGAGETHKTGRHSKALLKGLRFLAAQQKSDGKFGDSIYEHALATIALSEAYGLTGDAWLSKHAQAAVNYIALVQNRNGGWGYSPGAAADTSVTGWQFSALKAAAFAGLNVPPTVFSPVAQHLDRVASPDGLGYGYNSPSAVPSTSATGLLCREFLGWTPRDEALVKAVRHLGRPEAYVTREKPNLYFLFYATQVMHHFGGKEWEDWNRRTRDLLIDLQDQGAKVGSPHLKGSWSPLTEDFAKEGGRLMYTSLALLTLEAPYYSVPLSGYGRTVLQD